MVTRWRYPIRNGDSDNDDIWFSAQFIPDGSTAVAETHVATTAAVTSSIAPVGSITTAVSSSVAPETPITTAATSSVAPAASITAAIETPTAGDIAPVNGGRLPTLDAGLQMLAHAASGATTPLFPTVGICHAPNAISPDGQYVTIDAVAADGDGAALLLQLQAIGLQNGGSFKSMASGLLPVDQVDALLGIANLAHARESGWISNAGLVTTQADVSLHADIARTTFGFDGSGIKIGILSDSFATAVDPITTMAQDIASGDLPADTTILEDNADEPVDEGRAMAQIIHDLAPGASILFATANTGQANFANNIIALANAGAQVIVDDFFYFFEPMFQDGVIAQAVDQVVANGVIYFASAGNNGHAGYESPFIDGGARLIDGIAYTVHDFGTTVDGVESSLLQINQDDDTTYIFQWANAAASASPGVGAVTNLDFIGYSDPEATNQLFHFTLDETGVDPFNDLILNGERTFYLRIGLRSGPEPVALKIVPFNDVVTYGANTTNINDGTSYGHHAGAGAIPVGATDIRKTPALGTDPPLLQSFSSIGPLNIWVDTAGNILSSPQVRLSPAIVAPDGGDTTFFGGGDTSDAGTFPNFFGTSASAPAAAAIAALMLQARPALTASDIRNLLMDSAIDMDNPTTPGFDVGFDFGTGAGLIQADLAVGFASTLTITATAAHPLMFGTHFADTFRGGPENDTFTGFGAIDTLTFTPGGLADTFTDFIAGAGGDIVNLTAFGNITTLQAVLDRASQSGADTVIDLGNGDVVTLNDVTKGSLTIDNFLFAAAAHDFNADGRSDIFWQNDGGSLAVWQMAGFQISAADFTRLGASAVGLPGLDWHVIDTSDVSGDGKTDILWRTDAGKLAVWQMDGSHIVGADFLRIGATAIGAPAPDWHPLGAADFDGDGKGDLLWRTDGGQLAIWELNNSQIQAADFIKAGNTNVGVPALDWRIVGTGDFGGDGKADILWETTGGALALWQMDGTHIMSASFIKAGAANVGIPGFDWHVSDVADFDGDGKADILWRVGAADNPLTDLPPGGGKVAIWEMNGDQIKFADYTKAGANNVGAPGLDWHLLGADDHNGDGKGDLLWQTDAGKLAVWQMDGTHVAAADYTKIGATDTGVPAPDWHVFQHHYDIL